MHVKRRHGEGKMKKTVTIVSHFIKVAFLVAVVITSGCASTQSRSTVDQESAYHQHIKLALKYIGANDRYLARVHLEKAARKNRALQNCTTRMHCSIRLNKNLNLPNNTTKKPWQATKVTPWRAIILLPFCLIKGALVKPATRWRKSVKT